MRKAYQFDDTILQEKIIRIEEDDFINDAGIQPHLRAIRLQGTETIDIEHKMDGIFEPLIINGIPLQLNTMNVYVPLSAPITLKLKKSVTVASDVLVGMFGNGGWHE